MPETFRVVPDPTMPARERLSLWRRVCWRIRHWSAPPTPRVVWCPHPLILQTHPANVDEVCQFLRRTGRAYEVTRPIVAAIRGGRG